MTMSPNANKILTVSNLLLIKVDIAASTYRLNWCQDVKEKLDNDLKFRIPRIDLQLEETCHKGLLE